MTFSLQSGSNGNAIYVEADGVRLLFDAGISGRRAAERMQVHHRCMAEVDALVISHDHIDHIQCAGVYHRRYGMPVFMTERTRRAFNGNLGKLADARYFRSGDRLTFGDVTVHTIPTPHDAADGTAFVVECGPKRLGILTDLGHPFAELGEILGTVDAAYLESNYDPRMLEEGGYPADLKQRIRGPGGHLSNEESARLLGRCAGERLRWVAVAHLSENNNTPGLALAAHRARGAQKAEVHLAPRDRASDLLEV